LPKDIVRTMNYVQRRGFQKAGLQVPSRFHRTWSPLELEGRL